MKLVFALTITLSFISTALATVHFQSRIENVIWSDKPSLSTRSGLHRRDNPTIQSLSRSLGGTKSTPTKKRKAPTKVKRSTPSGVPISGIISVNRADNGAFLGYVKKTYINSSTKRFGLTNGAGSALSISGTSDPSGGPIEITEENGPDANNPFLGFAPNGSNTDLSPAQTNTCVLTGTHHTAANAPPANVGNSFNSGTSESTIWSYDAVTKKLTPQWVNHDGTKPATHLFYTTTTDLLFISGAATIVGGPVSVTFTVVTPS